MGFNVVLLLISLPVLAVCAFAMYMSMSGLEKEKKEKRVNDRKTLENELIWNGMWKLVGADPITLDKAIHFLLEDQKARARMSDEERAKKIALLREYKSTLKESRENGYFTINELGNWNESNYYGTLVTPLDEPQNSSLSDFEWIA